MFRYTCFQTSSRTAYVHNLHAIAYKTCIVLQFIKSFTLNVILEDGLEFLGFYSISASVTAHTPTSHTLLKEIGASRAACHFVEQHTGNLNVGFFCGRKSCQTKKGSRLAEIHIQ